MLLVVFFFFFLNKVEPDYIWKKKSRLCIPRRSCKCLDFKEQPLAINFLDLTATNSSFHKTSIESHSSRADGLIS